MITAVVRGRVGCYKTTALLGLLAFVAPYKVRRTETDSIGISRRRFAFCLAQ